MFVEDHSPADLELHKFHVSLRTGLTEKATTPIQPEPAIDEAGDDGWAEARWDETHHFYIRRDGRDRFLEMSVVDDCAGRETVLGTTQLDIARLRLARGPCVAVASVFNEQQQHVADLQVNQKALQLYWALTIHLLNKSRMGIYLLFCILRGSFHFFHFIPSKEP